MIEEAAEYEGRERVVRGESVGLRRNPRGRPKGPHGSGLSCRVLFFQAEDGIRDIGVTGVQTCALPICPTEKSAAGPAPPSPPPTRPNARPTRPSESAWSRASAT